MNLIKIIPIVFALAATSCASVQKQSAARSPSLHIGGSSPVTYIPAVRLGAERVLESCSAIFVSNRHLLTAAHCVSRETNILSGKAKKQVPFNDTVAVLEESGEVRQIDVEVISVNLYPAYYYNGDESALPTDVEFAALKSLLSVGDFAIIEVRDPISDKFVRTIRIEANASKDLIWVGGFGLKNGPWREWSEETYTGSFAKFGAERNSFSYSDPSFKADTEVSMELRDIGNDITYLNRGDSGGPVFKTIDDQQYVVAVNHSSPVVSVTILMKPDTGRVLMRPSQRGDLVGFAHRFSSKNQRLVNWIKSVLPAASYEIK